MVENESSPAETTCLGEQHSRHSVTCLVTLAFADAEEELRQNLSNLDLEQDDPSSKRSSPLMSEEDDGSITSELRELEGLENSVRDELREYEGLLLRQSQEDSQEENVVPGPLHVEKVSSELLPKITAAWLESSVVESAAAVKRFESEISPIVSTRIPGGMLESPARERYLYPHVPATPTSPDTDSPSLQETPSSFDVASSEAPETPTSPDVDAASEDTPDEQCQYLDMPATPTLLAPKSPSLSSDIPETPSSPDAVALLATESGGVVAHSRHPSYDSNDDSVQKDDPPMRSIFQKTHRYSVSAIESDESESFYPDDAPVEPKLRISLTDSTATDMSPTESSGSSTVEPISVTQDTSEPLPTQAFEDMLSAAYVQSGHGGMSLALASDMLAAQLNSNPGSILQQWLGRKFQADKSNQPSSPPWILGVPILGSASGTDDVLLMANTLSPRGA